MITGADQGAVVTFNGGDERDGDVPDPTDTDIVYGAGLGGRISKWRASTAQVQNVSPWPVSSYAENPRNGENEWKGISDER